MKKYFLGFAFAVLLILLVKSPSFVKADEYYWGKAVVEEGDSKHIVDVYVTTSNTPEWIAYSGGIFYATVYGSYYLYYNHWETHNPTYLYTASTLLGYFTFLPYTYSWNTGFSDGPRYFYTNEADFIANLPPDLLPEPSAWDNFWELYKNVYGFYPQPGSLLDMLRNLFDGDHSENTEILFPTLTPTPTPTPSPTPIPVQTIFVPDGNGNTTIIYQYPDPTTGVITQSPYNPNIENNITVNCDCNGSGGSGNNIFGTDPQDPYTLTSSMFWADGFGVEISDNPLTAANESQQTLAEAASDYAESVNVASNSFNILPAKWLTLVGLLGGILIIAGLIRTFLGG